MGQKSDYILRNKVTFGLHPTNPQLDIQPTGHCKYWVHEVRLMDHTDQNAQPHEQESQLISYSTVLAACVHGADGKCKGMLTPERLQVLHQKIQLQSQEHRPSPQCQPTTTELCF